MTSISYIQWCIISEGSSWSIHEIPVGYTTYSATKVIHHFQQFLKGEGSWGMSCRCFDQSVYPCLFQKQKHRTCHPLVSPFFHNGPAPLGYFLYQSTYPLLCIPCPIYLLNQNWSVGRGKYDLLVPGRKLWKELWDFYMWARFWALHIIRHWDTIGYWAWFNGSRAMTRISHIQWCMISEGNSWSIHEVLVVHSACSATKVIPNFQ